MVEELQGGVPITEEINPNTREYFPNHTEWLIKQGQRLILDSSMGDLPYTVPKNHYFYITYANVVYSGGAVNTDAGFITVQEAASDRLIVRTLPDAAGQGSSTAASFYPPLRIEGGITLDRGASNGVAHGTIIGFLVKKPTS